MQTYKYEISDGIAHAVENNNSIAFSCDILQQRKFNPNEEELKHSFAFLGDAAPERQEDLYYLNAVLVSAGWNKTMMFWYSRIVECQKNSRKQTVQLHA
jgi:hypothetical protein